MHRRQFIARLGGLAAGSAATLAAPPARACIWDRDTLAAEAQGALGVVPALVGGFARNPPKYYEMRLARIEAEHPELAATDGRIDTSMLALLPAYDDAAVACDRLGRHGDAIEWMARKHAVLTATRAEDAAEHWYRYRANLGTFHAHRWLKRPDKWDATADLDRAHELIAAAIEQNPDAHFGREVVQLRALAWLRERPQTTPEHYELPWMYELELEGHGMATHDNTYLADKGLGDAIPGLCGLIALGAAWDSFDVVHALARLLGYDGRQSLVQLARSRCAEIVEAGGGSLVIGAPTGDALLAKLPHSATEGGIEPSFEQLRERADAWSAKREAYLLERLDRGEHPDTDADFWSGFAGDPQRMDEDALGIKPHKWLHGCACSTTDGAASGLASALGLATLAGLALARGRR